MKVSDPCSVASGSAEGMENAGQMPVCIGFHLSAEYARQLRDIVHVPLNLYMVRLYDSLCQVLVHPNEVKRADMVHLWNLRSCEPQTSALNTDS